MPSAAALLVLLGALRLLPARAAASGAPPCELKPGGVCACEKASDARAVSEWLAAQSDCQTVRLESCELDTLPQWTPRQLADSTQKRVAYEIRSTRLKNWKEDLYTATVEAAVAGAPGTTHVNIQLKSLLVDSGGLESDAGWNAWLSAQRSGRPFQLEQLVIEGPTGYLKRNTPPPNAKMSARRVRIANLRPEGASWSELEAFVKSWKPSELELVNLAFDDDSRPALGATSELHKLPALTALTITGCRLVDADFSGSNLRNTVGTLTLSNNELTRLDLSALAAFQSLYAADLSHNSISQLSADDKKPSASGGELSLQLAYNQLHTLDLSALAALPNLQLFDASSNRIGTLQRSDGASANPLLESLLLERNQIADSVSCELFAGYPKLKIVDLSDNQIAALNVSDAQLEAGKSGHLCIFDLRNNRIEWLSPRVVHWAKAALDASRDRCTRGSARYNPTSAERAAYGGEAPLVLLAGNPWSCNCDTWNATREAAAVLNDSLNAACAVDQRADCLSRAMPKCKRRPMNFGADFISVFSTLLNQSAVCAPNATYVNGAKPVSDQMQSQPPDRAAFDPQLLLIVAVVSLVLCVAVGVTCLLVCRARSPPSDPHGQYAAPAAAQAADSAGGHVHEKRVNKNMNDNNMNDKCDAQEV